ncbi:MAG TPA: pyridoxal-dependent decarboxylase [Bryobacteraceae bacterium]|nr:pyridoxal-dependent decarboxylase [Bryobacteraceae bacterium]
MSHDNTVFRGPLHAALEYALDYLQSLDSIPVAPTATRAELLARLDKPLATTGTASEQVISELIHDVQGGILNSAGGRFFGWVIGGALPAALAADWLTSTWDQNAVLYAAGPAAALVEEIAGGWLKEILGLPPQASFALVTGCQMAHVTCLAAARHALLEKRGWDVEQRGLFGAPPIRILCSDQQHGSFQRAIRLLGFGLQQVTHLPTDDQGRVLAAALEQALAADPDAPSIVLLQAGDINTGAFDSFETLIPIAHRYQVWVHIDGAFGLWAAASPRYRHLTQGVAVADSWATDGHKWLNVPYDCGYAFVAHPDPHRAAMSYRAPYLTHDADARDQMDWTPEWSRRARGFSTYAALRQLGRDGIAELIDRCCHHAQALATRIGVIPGAELASAPILNQALVRFGDRTDEVIAAAVATGEAFFGGTTWRGQRAMRISVCNWQTTEQDIDRAVAALETGDSPHVSC